MENSNNHKQDPTEKFKDLGMVSFTPKNKSSSYHYYFFALVLLIIIIAVFSVYRVYFSVSTKGAGPANTNLTKQGESANQVLLFTDRFNLNSLDGKWTVFTEGERASVKAENNELTLQITEPPEDLNGQERSLVSLTPSMDFTGDFDASLLVKVPDLSGSASFTVSIQKEIGEKNGDKFWISVEPAFEGLRVSVLRRINGQTEQLGSKMFERRKSFTVRMVKEGKKATFFVNELHLAETEKLFSSDVVKFLLSLTSGEPGFNKATVMIDNFVVAKK